MLDRIRHRGPDDTDEKLVGATWLGHSRLSIVDVGGGAQPLTDREGRVWFVGNAEIYNHLELRARLGEEKPLTDSDCEAALHAVIEWGPRGVAELRGMFAFCIVNSDGNFLAARDPVGIKPLYWVHDGDRALFASELRAFDLDLQPKVETFPPAHYWTPEEGLVRYRSLRTSASPYTSQDAARQAVRDTLIAAVERRMMADVDVGVFLSGGLDSSLVAAIAKRWADQRGKVLRSFAVGADGSPDLAAARTVAEYLGLEHHERTYTIEEATGVLEHVVFVLESYEPSLVRSAVPNYLLAELAARHVKVVLTGEGADELFAGYDYMRDIDEHQDLRDEIVRSVESLHNLNLQRCDRVTMAHGLEARVPFLDVDMIAVAQRVPIEWKLPGDAGEEKRILREAFSGWLPDEVLWRRKAQFGDGSGAADILQNVAEALVGEDRLNGHRVEGLPAPRSCEELAYQRAFARRLGGIKSDEVLGRFATE